MLNFVKWSVCYNDGRCEHHCKQGDSVKEIGQWFNEKGSCSGHKYNQNCDLTGTTCGEIQERGYVFNHDYTLKFPECCHKIRIKI